MQITDIDGLDITFLTNADKKNVGYLTEKLSALVPAPSQAWTDEGFVLHSAG